MKYRVLLVGLGLPLAVQVWLLLHSNSASGQAPAPFAPRRGNDGKRQLPDERRSGGWRAEVTDRLTDHGRFGSLPAGKVAVVRKIETDYAEMRLLERPINGTPGPAEVERRRLLRDEMHRDVAAVLSPAELELYEQRNSIGARRTGAAVHGLVDLSDAEFLALAQLQDRFEVDHVRRQTKASPDHAQIRAILPDDRFYTYLARIDPVYQVLAEFARSRPGILPARTYELYQLQRAAWDVCRESKLDSPDGKRRLAELNVRLETLLGTEGALAYRRSYFGEVFAYPTIDP